MSIYKGNVKVASNGGGGAPTLTWFDNVVGATLDISSLTGTVSKVYKNGELLQPYTDVTKHYYTATDNGDYILINDYIDFNSADTWLIIAKFKNSSSWPETRLIVPALVDFTTPVFATYNNRTSVFLTSNGNSWNLAHGSTSSKTLSSNSEPFFYYGFDGNKYFVDVSYDGITKERFWELSSTTKIYSDSTNSRIALLNNPLGDIHAPTISMPIEDFKIFTDNTLVFNGATAVENTNWTNVGCTETEEIVPSNNGYKVSGSNIIFTQDLLPTDKIAVETV